MQSHTLEGLAVYTQYLVYIKVYNPEGSGPETIEVVMTDEGGQLYIIINMFNKLHVSAPSSPRNVKLLSIMATSIQLSWWEPARPNGIIQGYRLYFKHNNLTSVQQVRQDKSAVMETLTSLGK
jgi:hypothetical protein